MGHSGLPAAGLPPPPGSLWTEGPVRLRHHFFYSLAGILYDSSSFVKGEVLVFGKYPALAVRDNYALDLAAIARKNNIGDVTQTFAVAAVYDLESAQFAKR